MNELFSLLIDQLTKQMGIPKGLIECIPAEYRAQATINGKKLFFEVTTIPYDCEEYPLVEVKSDVLFEGSKQNVDFLVEKISQNLPILLIETNELGTTLFLSQDVGPEKGNAFRQELHSFVDAIQQASLVVASQKGDLQCQLSMK